MTRDQFLTELMGQQQPLYFSNWISFGLLWNYAKEQEDWDDFLDWYYNENWAKFDINMNNFNDRVILSLVNLNIFSDTYARFKGWREK